jgi:hypothetical protein
VLYGFYLSRSDSIIRVELGWLETFSSVHSFICFGEPLPGVEPDFWFRLVQ